MGFLDAHAAKRVTKGLLIIAADKSKFDHICDGSVDDTTRDAVWGRVFPLETIGAETKRTPRVAVRTAYPKGGADGRTPPDPAAVAGQGSTGGATITIDLVDEHTVKRSMGGMRKIQQETIEIMISAGTKDDVRVLHEVVGEILEDSIRWFESLGYVTVLCDGPSGDLRPADGQWLGQPHLLGAFNRFIRVTTTVGRMRTRIFTTDTEKLGTRGIRVNNVDAEDDKGHQGDVEPRGDGEGVS